jgi:putative hemolysin
LISATVMFWIAVAGLICGSILAALFFCLQSMVRTTLEELAASRASPGAIRRIDRILEDVDGHTTAVALPRIVCNMITAVATVAWVGAFDGDSKLLTRDLIIGIAAASILIWVFGLVIPHSIAAYAAEGTVYTWSRLIRLCHIIQMPLRRVVTFTDEIVRRLAGKEPTSEGEQIQAELMSVVEEARHEGQFDETERDMIEAVVGLRGTTVEQIMTPRTEVEALALTNNLGEITRFIKASRHSRIPVYEGSLDQVVGMFYIKDLMRWLAGDGTRGTGKPFELKSILRPALFVPETKTIRELFAEMLDKKVHIAMIADEYGGTSGLVTLEDIMEEVFGEIQDEYEIQEDEAPVVTVAPGSRTADIDARAYIDAANDVLKALDISLPEGEDYDTVGGLIVTTLGRIPEPGEVVNIGDAVVHIVEAEPTRVIRVKLESGAAEPQVTVTEPKPEETVEP